MKFKHYLLTGLCTVSLLGLSSCFDDNYDLTDIDTTSRIELKDLTIPLKVNSVKLDQIFEIGEESQVKKMKDPVTGQDIYAVLEDGTFNSGNINIPTFNTSKPSINAITDELPLEVLNDLDAQVDNVVQQYIEALLQNNFTQEEAEQRAEERREEEKQNVWNALSNDEVLGKYEIKNLETSFETTSTNVDKSVRSIDKIGVDGVFYVKLSINNLKDVLSYVNIDNLKIKLPKGLKITCSEKEAVYDENTGILDLSNADIVIRNGVYNNLSVIIKEISNTDEFTFTPSEDGPGTVTFKSIVKSSGSVNITKKNFKPGKTFFDLPKEGSYVCEPNLSAINVQTFTGNIRYDVGEVNVNPIALNGIPDVFAGEETNIFLSNPQIYLTISNPLSEEKIYAETKISLTAEKDGVKRNTNTMDEMIRVSGEDDVYCISPADPSNKYPGYENSKWQKFTTLSDIISGNGIPDKVYIDVINPKVPEQKVYDFNLGKEIGTVKGKYLFYAPMALKENSLIVYRTEMDGWNDETLNKVTINKLSVKANVDSELPFEAEVTIKPIYADGTEIPGVTFNKVKINAYAKNQEFSIAQESGVIKNLDGIKIVAYINSKDNSKSISPQQTLKVNNLKVTVDGYYEDEL